MGQGSMPPSIECFRMTDETGIDIQNKEVLIRKEMSAGIQTLARKSITLEEDHKNVEKETQYKKFVLFWAYFGFEIPSRSKSLAHEPHIGLEDCCFKVPLKIEIENEKTHRYQSVRYEDIAPFLYFPENLSHKCINRQRKTNFE